MIAPIHTSRRPHARAENMDAMQEAMRRILTVLEGGRAGVAADMLRAAIRDDVVMMPADADDPYGDDA